MSTLRDGTGGIQWVTTGLRTSSGSGEANSPGARLWAAERPNLLNVAVSRAKRRFYVVGNRKLWKDLRFFDRLAASLPVHEWR